MNTDKTEKDTQEIDQVTDKVIGAAFKVSNTLGCGFLEKVYENALCIELRKAGLQVDQQYGVAVKYDAEVVGEYVADILVQKMVMVELKAVKAIDDIHVAQCLNYLKATRLSVCLLINFARPKLEFRRISL